MKTLINYVYVTLNDKPEIEQRLHDKIIVVKKCRVVGSDRLKSVAGLDNYWGNKGLLNYL